MMSRGINASRSAITPTARHLTDDGRRSDDGSQFQDRRLGRKERHPRRPARLDPRDRPRPHRQELGAHTVDLIANPSRALRDERLIICRISIHSKRKDAAMESIIAILSANSRRARSAAATWSAVLRCWRPVAPARGRRRAGRDRLQAADIDHVSIQVHRSAALDRLFIKRCSPSPSSARTSARHCSPRQHRTLVSLNRPKPAKIGRSLRDRGAAFHQGSRLALRDAARRAAVRRPLCGLPLQGSRRHQRADRAAAVTARR